MHFDASIRLWNSTVVPSFLLDVFELYFQLNHIVLTLLFICIFSWRLHSRAAIYERKVHMKKEFFFLNSISDCWK